MVGNSSSLQSYRCALCNDSNQIAYKVVAYSVTSCAIVCLGSSGCTSMDAETGPGDAAQRTAHYSKYKLSSKESPVQEKTQEMHIADNYIPSR